MSDDDSWGPGLAAPPDTTQSKLYDGTPIRAELLALADEYIAHPPTGTINCIAVNEKRRHLGNDNHERSLSQACGPRGRFAPDRLRAVRR